ncbi:MAG: helix-turn-helix domain-containing protein [Sheuella sp.]|nr:helix-turn-helix domain-containing protein [Sheuella sp.]
MNTLKAIADSLLTGRRKTTDIDLARQTGLTRQSIGRALSGEHNFGVTTLLAIAEANDQQVLIVPSQVARALIASNQLSIPHVQTMTEDLGDL